MDLDRRTLDTLDWTAVLAALARRCRTLRGQRTAAKLPLVRTRDAAGRLQAAVRELAHLELDDRMPIAEVLDIDAFVKTASAGRMLEGSELATVGSCLVALESLRLWVVERADDAPVLTAMVEAITVDPELMDRLSTSFDERGQLSDRRYPELGDLRRRIREGHQRIQSSLDRLVKSDELAGVLQDRFVTQRGDRYVLPVRADRRRKGLGIVHDTSGSGETVFVEPAEVVELNNKLRLAEGELRRAETRILQALTALIARFQPDIQRSLVAAVKVDLTAARKDLGEKLGASFPILGNDGVIHLKQARHPVLQLRGLDVVPNDLQLDGTCSGLILSGPNTGGKTIALKTLGLAALFVRAGIPFPAAPGSRIDLFTDVIADIGDLQSVEGDLSTFSGHVMVLKELLRRAGPGVLVLLDEVAVGTDPAQGAALARAVLEQLVEQGCRVGVTTHYTELKAFAAGDPRFSNAAVHLEDGRPTYRVEKDAVGLSHAFRIARGLGLDGDVVDRAEGCVDPDARRLANLLADLEVERVQAVVLRRELAEHKAEAQAQKAKLDDAWERIRGKTAELARKEAQQSVNRLQAVEADVAGLVAALQKNPNLRTAGKTLKQIREATSSVRPKRAAPEPAPQPPRALKRGDRVRVQTLGKTGTLTADPRKGRVEVDIGGLKTRVKLNDCVLLDAPKPVARPKPKVKAVADAPGGVRTDRNSCDLRGKRALDAIEEVEFFLDRLVMSGEPLAWILHGHGTGSLKTAVRQYLPKAPHAQTWRPANADEGGDAWTVVTL
jgi:DNA mismatch repair protein MutS2